LGLSKLIYNASVLVIPAQLIKETNSIIFNFIWDKKPPKIKKSTIIGERKHRVAWIPRIKSENVASWKIISNAALERYAGLHFLTNCNYDINTLQVGNIPPFYVDEWQMTKDSVRSETSITYEEVIWNNQKILINVNPVFYKSWFDENIIRIQNLFQEDAKFQSFKNFCYKFKLKTPFTLFFGLMLSRLLGG